jgi:hypothetical protein
MTKRPQHIINGFFCHHRQTTQTDVVSSPARQSTNFGVLSSHEGKPRNKHQPSARDSAKILQRHSNTLEGDAQRNLLEGEIK